MKTALFPMLPAPGFEHITGPANAMEFIVSFSPEPVPEVVQPEPVVIQPRELTRDEKLEIFQKNLGYAPEPFDFKKETPPAQTKTYRSKTEEYFESGAWKERFNRRHKSDLQIRIEEIKAALNDNP